MRARRHSLPAWSRLRRRTTCWRASIGSGLPCATCCSRSSSPITPRTARTSFLEGPAVELSPKAALALGIAFHELATNAAKYGALSTLPGRVRVTWEVGHASQPVLRLTWAESGGPPLAQIGKRGFGSTLLERGLSLELDGAVAVDFAPGGLICTMEISLDASRKGGA